MSGIVGRFLLSFGLTMAFAIAVSMLVAFTLTPMMAARMLPVPPADGEHRRRSWLERGSDFIYRPIARLYVAVLAWSLRHRWVIVLLIVGTCASTIPMAKHVGGGFLPPADDAQFEIYIQTPEATSIEEATLIGERLARKVRQFPEVDSTLVTFADTDQKQVNVGRVYVHLVDPEKRVATQADVMQRTREQVLNAAPAGTRVAAQEVNDFSLGGQNAAVSYLISGPDLDKLERYGKQLMIDIKKIPGVTDLDSSILDPLAETQVVPDFGRAATLGVDLGDVVAALQILIGGNQASTFEVRGDEYPVWVRAALRYRDDPHALALIAVPSRTLGQVPLSDVVTVGVNNATSKIVRMSRERAVTITCNVAPGFSENTVATGVENAIKNLQMSQGYSWDSFGRSKELGRMQLAFIFAIGMAFAFMYIVLAAQFESLIYPVVIMLALPLTLPFAVLSLLITGGSLNIFSMLGVLVLFGMVKKNAILQVDHANQLRREGLPRTEAVLAASRDRLRPILMTTFAFVAGMAPLVLTHGVGSAMSRAMASIVLGGQSLSLLLTLIAIPVLYTLFDDLANVTKRGFRRVFLRGKPPTDRGAKDVGVVDMSV
jgi:multidrug efflux pump subunit AcrB